MNMDNGNFRLKVVSNEMEIYFTDIGNRTNVQGHISIDILFVVYR